MSACERAVSALTAKAVSPETLADVDAEKLKALIAHKKRTGKDVITIERPADDAELVEENDVDLLQTIRRASRMAGGGKDRNHNSGSSARGKGHDQVKEPDLGVVKSRG